ncbi:MAG: hypothetical protein IKJ11_00085 [Clostridia bacterium]|nr:hypothetical protein [Clostridia bacterium]
MPSAHLYDDRFKLLVDLLNHLWYRILHDNENHPKGFLLCIRFHACTAVPSSLSSALLFPFCPIASRFIEWIEEMNRDFGIPAGFSQIRAEDIPCMAAHAHRECNPLYPVPLLLNRHELEAMYHQLMRKEENP